MSGVTSLVDTLLATKLSQRVDLLALRSQVEVAGPDAANPVEQVENDVRLPSRAATERPLGAQVAGWSEAAGGAVQASRGGEAATLSAAARAISALLGDVQEGSEPVRGAAPLWSAAVAPVPAQLADALARIVVTSGLFYESHLAKFYAGARPLAQLAQEPQARLGAWAGLGAADPGPDAVATIHPQAMALVRQQLELLATAVFRWVGEAWMGVPMDWQISERDGDAPEGVPDPAQRAWRTTVALTLPGLGALQMMLSGTGSELQVRLASSEPATVALLKSGSESLPRRFAAAGLHLTDLRVAALPTAPAPGSVEG